MTLYSLIFIRISTTVRHGQTDSSPGFLLTYSLILSYPKRKKREERKEYRRPGQTMNCRMNQILCVENQPNGGSCMLFYRLLGLSPEVNLTENKIH